MKDQIKLLREALLNLHARYDPYALPGVDRNCEVYEQARQALAATEQPAVEQEPVARVDDLERGGRVRALALGLALDQPLFSAPPEVRDAFDRSLIVRGCCEAERADPDHPDTICINVHDLIGILDQYAAPVAQQPQAEAVSWGIDWGTHGDITCVSIIKKHADGTVEVVATEYEPESLAPQQAEAVPSFDAQLREVAKRAIPQQAEAVPLAQIVNCDTCKHSANSCDDYPCNRCGFEFGDGPFDRWESPQQAEAKTVYRLAETDIYDFAGWLTTRHGVLEVGSSKEAGPMAEAVGEYLRAYPERFAPQQAETDHELCPSCRNGDLYACTCTFPKTKPEPEAVPPTHVLAPVDVLKAAAESLGNFVSDHGWTDADMRAMDNLDAIIAQQKEQAK